MTTATLHDYYFDAQRVTLFRFKDSAVSEFERLKPDLTMAWSEDSERGVMARKVFNRLTQTSTPVEDEESVTEAFTTANVRDILDLVDEFIVIVEGQIEYWRDAEIGKGGLVADPEGVRDLLVSSRTRAVGEAFKIKSILGQAISATAHI